MKNFISLLCGLFLFSMWANGQSGTDSPPPQPDVQKLVLTTSPAFVLLGVQPTNIDRPSTPRDFAAGIQSAMVNNSLQPNFAMEFNPFNWGNKKDSSLFNAVEYLSGNAWEAIKRNFAISAATSQSDTVVFGSLQPGNGLGYGVRITILPGKVNDSLYHNYIVWESADSKIAFLQLLNSFIPDRSRLFADKVQASYNAEVRNINTNTSYLPSHAAKLKDELDSYVNFITMEWTELSNTIKNQDSLTKTIQAKIRSHISDLKDARNGALVSINAQKIPFAREGFILELAASGVTVFQNNKWDNSVFAKSGIWLTPSYRFNLAQNNPKLIQSLDILGVARYLWNAGSVDKANYFDLGAKVQFNRNEWNASFEGVARYATKVPEGIKSNWTYCMLANFSYTLQQNITLRFSFGSNFDGNSYTYTQPKDLVAIGGISLGFLK